MAVSAVRPIFSKMVGLDSGGEGYSVFYLELTGAVLIRKTEVE